MLAKLTAMRGVPALLRSDNGPEFVALVEQSWLKTNVIGTRILYGVSPFENAYVKSFNSRLRDKYLNREEFASHVEAQVLADQRWRNPSVQAIGYEAIR